MYEDDKSTISLAVGAVQHSAFFSKGNAYFGLNRKEICRGGLFGSVITLLLSFCDIRQEKESYEVQFGAIDQVIVVEIQLNIFIV